MRLIGGAAIVAVPALVAVSDELRMVAEGTFSTGLVDTEYGVDSVLRDLAAIEANRGLFELAAALYYASTLLMIPALLAIWRLSVDRSPRWAWTGAVMAALGVCGLMVHITGYQGGMITALDVTDQAGAAELIVEMGTTPFVVALFTPFFLALLAPLPQAVGLRRAGVLPLWACLAVVAATVLSTVIGSTPWSVAVAGVLFVAGFAPAALAVLRQEPAEATVPEQRTEAGLPA